MVQYPLQHRERMEGYFLSDFSHLNEYRRSAVLYSKRIKYSSDNINMSNKRNNRKKLTAVSIVAIAVIGILIALNLSGILQKDRSQNEPVTRVAEDDSDNNSDTEQSDRLKSSSKAEKSGETENSQDSDPVKTRLDQMTTDEKIGQLFIVVPDSITGASPTIAAGKRTYNAINKYKLCGFIYMSANLTGPDQTRNMLKTTKQYYDELGLPVPFLCVDEEGGSVARIANNPDFNVKSYPDMITIGESGDVNKAAEAGSTIGSYLHDLGFNTDFAPCADVLTNPNNTVVAKRSFGSDPDLVKNMTKAFSKSLLKNNVIPTLKHFPGHGATREDSHSGAAYTNKTLDEMIDNELVPFTDVDEYAPMIMAGHISAPNITGDNTPASLSKKMITEILRKKLGYSGIIITDAMNMGAVADNYSCGNACVMAIKAGCDIILAPSDIDAGISAVRNAVSSGEISEKRLDKSVYRILKVKQQLADNA